MYNLIFITGHIFLGQFNTLDSCNKAIRMIFERQLIPYPQYVMSKDQMAELQKSVDLKLQYQTEYVCVKK